MTHTIASASIAQMTSANKARSFDGVYSHHSSENTAGAN